MTAAAAPEIDPLDARHVRGATGLLRTFNDAGVLSAADVHVALRLAALAEEPGEAVQLAVALAVRGPRLGHVFVDLNTIGATATSDYDDPPVDIATLPWPPPEHWIFTLQASELVALGEDDPQTDRPLRLLGSRLYLDRYWREERSVAADIEALAVAAAEVLDSQLDTGLARLFPADADEGQRGAAGAAVRRRFAVVAGGPGTGKTTTVARIVALLAQMGRASADRLPLVALAAPTGKAAARLREAVHEETGRLPVDDEVRALLLGLRASTLHRLLGWRPDSRSRFVHHRGNRLPHDVVIVDETSMVSLTMMARLVEAVRPDARLILVGDPGQLTSIEAGVVLDDIVAPERERRSGNPIGEGIAVLERVHRYGGGIATLADAIRRGNPDAAVEALRAAPGEVTWLPFDASEADPTGSDLRVVRARAVESARALTLAARDGRAEDALEALGRFRLLCAHRRGPHGVSGWTSRIQAWLAAEIEELDLEQRDYAGRPLLVSENDYELGLWNGDTGVLVQGGDGDVSAVFERGRELLRFSPLRLGAVETVYAMTIHKSQGSQFETAAVLLPPAESRILTRELLYTAVTRTRQELILVGTEATIRSAVQRPVARASGLRERLWRPARPTRP
jgi:exodeoxyribonuclease V alpha subunit